MTFFESKNLRVRRLADDVAMLVLDADGETVNRITPDLLDELDTALGRIEDSADFATLVICSAKPTSFCNGIDPLWLAGHATAGELSAFSERGQKVCQKLAGLDFPSIAVIAGACLGAGLELAIACDHRVAVDRPASILGFNDVELGLISCFGGTQRLPRLIGLTDSLKLLSGARRLRPAEARALGVVDEVCNDGDDTPPEQLIDPAKRDWMHFPRRTLRQKLFESNSFGRRFLLRGARRILSERLPQDMPAPWEALEAVQLAVQNPESTAGLEFERQAVARLVQTPAFSNLLHLRLERERRRKEAPKAEAARFLRSIGIVGATEAAKWLVRQAVLRGCQVVLHDNDKTALGYAFFELHRGFQEEIRRGSLPPEVGLKSLEAIRGTAEWQHFNDLDLVLDTLDDGGRVERFRHLDGITTPATILASTGLADTVVQLREGLAHPHRVGVLHFPGEPEHAALAELACPSDAAEPVQRRLEEWAASLGKLCVPVTDRPGLLVLRIWLPAFNEAVLLLQEGMRLDRIDQAMTRFGTVQGPLEMMDQIGLDVTARLVAALRPVLGERVALHAGFAEMAQQQMLGVRSGAGFYRHAGTRRRANPRAVALWRRDPGEAWLQRSALSQADQLDLAQRRMVSLMVLEAVHCIREKIVADAATLDFAMATAGWAPHRGGPLTYARQLGADALLQWLETLQGDFGGRFAPPGGFREAIQG